MVAGVVNVGAFATNYCPGVIPVSSILALVFFFLSMVAGVYVEDQGSGSEADAEAVGGCGGLYAFYEGAAGRL